MSEGETLDLMVSFSSWKGTDGGVVVVADDVVFVVVCSCKCGDGVVVVVVVGDCGGIASGLLKTEKPPRVPSISIFERFKTLRLGNWEVVAIVGIESWSLLERLRVWRLEKRSGALNNGSMFLSQQHSRFKVTMC